jgi:ElaB/YqjD/DUF883 family membrane-anchored ribosome-binding protein
MDTPKKEDHKESGTEATAAALTEDVSRLKKNVTQLGADAKAHGQAHIDAAQERLYKAVKAAKAQLAAQPLAILGVGIVLGYFFGRRGRRHRHTD